MPSTVYKGDLAEVSFAPETGMIIRDNTDVSIAVANSGNITTITFSSQNNSALFDSSAKLKYPKNMLVGSQLVFKAASSSTINAGDLPDTGNGGRIFTIVENNGTTIKITPAMVTSAGGSVNFSNNDSIIILPYKTPPMDVAMTHTTAGESVKTDQFLGIATALTLPETKVDLKRFHVVGLGRDVSIQVPGKLINEGGSFEVAMHSARWLKYCLGHELINSPDNGSVATALSSASLAGQSHIIVASKSGIAVDDYIEIRDDAPIVPVVSSHEPDGGTWDGTLTDFEFDNAKPHEVRRVIGVSSVDTTLYLPQAPMLKCVTPILRVLYLSWSHQQGLLQTQLKNYSSPEALNHRLPLRYHNDDEIWIRMKALLMVELEIQRN